MPGLDGETAFTAAYTLAARTSAQWLDCLAGLMNTAGLTDFRADVKQLGVCDDDYLSDTVP